MYPYVDMHCDTLWLSMQDGFTKIYENGGMQSIHEMQMAKQMCQFFAVFFPPRRPDLPPDEEFFETLRSNLLKAVEVHNDCIGMAYHYDDIIRNHKAGRSSAILTVEDGRMVQGNMETLHRMYEKGVRAIALTWNYENCFGSPNSSDLEIMKKGLTSFGKEAVQEMENLGILTDVSHLSDGGFYDVADICKKPFIASHSNCRELTPHQRNLSDDMIRILANHGGVSGINFCPAFISPDVNSMKSTVEDLTGHVLHFINVGGEDCVGIGTDFDGIEGELEIGHPTQMQLLFDALEKKGVTERQLDKIASGNVLRVIKETMK